MLLAAVFHGRLRGLQLLLESHNLLLLQMAGLFEGHIHTFFKFFVLLDIIKQAAIGLVLLPGTSQFIPGQIQHCLQSGVLLASFTQYMTNVHLRKFLAYKQLQDDLQIRRLNGVLNIITFRNQMLGKIPIIVSRKEDDLWIPDQKPALQMLPQLLKTPVLHLKKKDVAAFSLRPTVQPLLPLNGANLQMKG